MVGLQWVGECDEWVVQLAIIQIFLINFVLRMQLIVFKYRWFVHKHSGIIICN